MSNPVEEIQEMIDDLYSRIENIQSDFVRVLKQRNRLYHVAKETRDAIDTVISTGGGGTGPFRRHVFPQLAELHKAIALVHEEVREMSSWHKCSNCGYIGEVESKSKAKDAFSGVILHMKCSHCGRKWDAKQTRDAADNCSEVEVVEPRTVSGKDD